MAIAVKICGLTHREALDAAVEGGARYLGFVFHPRSPRSLDLASAAELAGQAPADRGLVGVVVDPDDAFLADLLARVALDHLQLHGRETPERVAEIRARTGVRVIKAIPVAAAEDLASVGGYAAAADVLLFDAKAAETPGHLPGGNAHSFDWRLLDGLEVACPWLLAGGLDEANLGEAVRLSGARAVDVSSGVELRPGVKDPDKVRRFLALAADLA